MSKNLRNVLCGALFALTCCSQGGKGSETSTPPTTPTTPTTSAPLNLNGTWRFSTIVTSSTCTPQPSPQETVDMVIVHDLGTGAVRFVRSSLPDALGVLSQGGAVYDLTVEAEGVSERTRMWMTFTANSGIGVHQRDTTPAAPGVACTTISDLFVTRISGGVPVTHPVPGMVSIPPGTFWMGSEGGSSDEAPVHRVSITRPFWMSKYEVTQNEYASVMGGNPTPSWRPLGHNLPVVGMSWEDAVVYCTTITARERAGNRIPPGYEYRMPTEAEWEYCCRAGTTSEWSFGNTLTCAQANFGGCVQDYVAVGSYQANAFGLHDMHGNVEELCMDCWIRYPAVDQTDPFNNPYLYENRYHSLMVRGGNSVWNVASCRSASRSSSGRTSGDSNTGFRIVLGPVLVH